MELFEAAFETASYWKLQVVVEILWNTKEPKKALNPNEEIGKHFSSGDTFGVHGNIRLASSSNLRFVVGTKVQCRTGETQWEAGTIIELNYRESSWPPGETVPYFVKLDDGDFTFVPQDADHLCKKLVPLWWSSFMDQPKNKVAELAMAELEMARQDKDVDAKNYLGETALLAAVMQNWTAGVEALLEMRAAVDYVDNKGQGALHRACSCGPAMMSLLLAAKADPNLQDTDPDFDLAFTSATFGDHPEHRTALHYSCLEGDLESAGLLVQARADLNIQDGQRKTPLHLAIEENHGLVIDLMLQSGSDVDMGCLESGLKNSPLMDAAHSGKHMLVGKLLAAGANVNKVGKQDMTALHLAARRGDLKTVKFLLDAKADAALESKCGTASHLASKHGSTELLELFGASSAPSAKTPLTQAERAALYMD